MACQATDNEVLLCSFPSMTNTEDGIAIPKANYVEGAAEFNYTPSELRPGPSTPTPPDDFTPLVFDSLSDSIPGRYNFVNCEFDFTTWTPGAQGSYYEFNFSANNVALHEDYSTNEMSPLTLQTDLGTATNAVAASVCCVVDVMTGERSLSCRMADGRLALVALNDGSSVKIPQGGSSVGSSVTFSFTPSPLPFGNTPEPPADFLSNFKFTNSVAPSEAPKLLVKNGTVQVKEWSYEEGSARYEVAIMVDGVDIMGGSTLLQSGDYDVNIQKAT